MLFYRLYRPLGRVGTVIPRGDKFDLLNFVLPEKFDYKVGFFVIHDYLVNGFRTRGKKSKDIPERIRYAYLVRLTWGVRRIYPR